MIFGTLSDGYLYCKVHQPAVYTVNKLDFDLSGKSYFFLMAIGPAIANAIKEHTTDLSSSSAIDMNQVIQTTSTALSSSTTIRTTSSLTISSSTSTPVSQVVYEGCGTAKGCFGSEETCVENQSCRMVTAYRPLNTSHFELEIYGLVNQTDRYVAVGFSNDNKMV